MKQGLLFVALFAASFLPASCTKNEEQILPIENNSLIGGWIFGESRGDTTFYQKVETLQPNQYGYIFKNGGELLVRGSAGFCGTPPSYADYTGSWNLKGSVLTLNKEYWGGKMIIKCEVISVSDKIMSVKEISVEFPK